MFKSPDIKAPRFRKECKDVLTTELFRKFREKHPQHNIEFSQFKEAITNHSLKMREVVISTREGISLPEGIGNIFLGSTKITKKSNFDIQASIKAGYGIIHKNWETDGYVGKIYFTNHLTRGTDEYKSVWSFFGHRDFKRDVSKRYPKSWKMYMVFTTRGNPSKVYRKYKFKHYMEARTEEALKTYNEFDL